jgi:RNA polymerase sigma-70 factor (ECF subfamily)
MARVTRVRGQRRAAVADDAALRALWDEHAGPVLAFATRVTGDRGRAEDVLQETLLRAWQHPEALDPSRGPSRRWLLTVANRIVIDEHRARRARPHEVSEAELRDGAPSAPGDEAIEQALESWLVADALAELSPPHREALLHTYYAGRTAADAASRLGVPEGTVRSRVHYALRALKVALEERGVTP